MRAARRATGGAGGGTHARGAANAPARAQRRARRRQAEAARALHGGLHHGCARAVQKRAGPPARAGPPNRAGPAQRPRALLTWQRIRHSGRSGSRCRRRARAARGVSRRGARSRLFCAHTAAAARAGRARPRRHVRVPLRLHRRHRRHAPGARLNAFKTAMKRKTGAHDASDAAATRCGAAVAFYRHVTDRGYAGDDAGTPEMRSARLWLNTNASRLLLDVFAPCADALTAQPRRTRSSAAAAPRRRASPARGLRLRNGAQRSAFARQRSQPRGPLQPPQQRSRQPRPEAQTTSLHLPRHQAVARRFAASLLALRLHP
jgi:hypothetical protein